jgi:glycosyltransferase involved in cell wall biosynthesis
MGPSRSKNARCLSVRLGGIGALQRFQQEGENRAQSDSNMRFYWADFAHASRRTMGRRAVLILPSQWEKAFARVILEAQANGIPVLGRNVGGCE